MLTTKTQYARTYAKHCESDRGDTARVSVIDTETGHAVKQTTIKRDDGETHDDFAQRVKTQSDKTRTITAQKRAALDEKEAAEARYRAKRPVGQIIDEMEARR